MFCSIFVFKKEVSNLEFDMKPSNQKCDDYGRDYYCPGVHFSFLLLVMDSSGFNSDTHSFSLSTHH